MDSKKDSQSPEEKKQNRKNAKKRLAETVYEARKKLIEGLTSEAHELVYNVLTEEKEKLGGEHSIFLLPGLFIITQTHILEGRAKKAEDFLTAAYWNFLKHSKVDENKQQNKAPAEEGPTKQEYNQYKTNLHRTFSKLYMLKNDYNESINELQMAIYLDCLKYGPEHPVTSLNYYLMGRIFREQGRVEQCESFFGKLAEIWYRYLKSYFKKSPQQQEQFLVDELVLEEALENLKSVEKHFEGKYPEEEGHNVFIPVMRTLYSIGMLYRIFNQQDLCRDYLRAVYKRCELFLPKNDKKTQKIMGVLKAMGSEGGSQEGDDDDRSGVEAG